MSNKFDADTVKKLIDLGLLDENEFKEKVLENTDNVDILIPYLYDDYMKEIEGFSYGTKNTYKYAIHSFFNFVYKKDNINDVFDLYKENNAKQITYQDVENWIKDLSDSVTQSTKRIYKTALQQLFNYVNAKYYDYFPNIESLKIPMESKNIEEVALREEEIIGIINSTSRKQDELLITLLYRFGLKRIELRNLKEKAIDFEKTYLKIYNNDGEIDRIAELTPDLIVLINEFLTEKTDLINETNETRKRRSDRTGEPYDPIQRSEYLFQTYRHVNDERINPATINTILSKAVKEYYLNELAKEFNNENELNKAVNEKEKKITTETIRDSRRVKLLADGIPEAKVMAIMGDTNITVTRRYIKIAQFLYPEKFKI